MMNKKLCYGIRKYKVGVASIAVGTALIIGIDGMSEAQASEVKEAITTETESTTTHTDVQHSEDVTSETSSNLETLSNNTPSANTVNDTHNTTSTMSNEKLNEPSTLVSSENHPRETIAPVTSVLQKNDLNQSEQIKAEDVSNKIEVVNSSIKGNNGATTVNPQLGERITLEYDLKFKSGIQKGNYFDIKLSDNVDTKGAGVKKKMPDIIDGTNIIASGNVLNDGSIRYTFTDYVSKKQDISAKLLINLFFVPAKVLNEGKQTVQSTIGSKNTSSTFDIKYLDGVLDKNNVNLNGTLRNIDKENGTLTHYAVVNSERKDLSHVNILGRLTHGNVKSNTAPKIKIYEYTGTDKFPKSLYVDMASGQFKDVTNQMNLKIENNGDYLLKMDKLDNKVYIIQYDSHFDKSAPVINFQTYLTGYGNDGELSTLTWNNGVRIYANNANGTGKDKPQDKPQDKPKEIVIESGNLIDLDFNSLETITGDGNYKVIEETDDNHLVDIIEITTPEGDNGHIDGIIDTIEDNNLIDIEEESGNGEINGEINGPIEVIEDGNITDIISGIGTENGSNNITIEEDTDIDKPTIEVGSHDPIEIIIDTVVIENGLIKGVIIEEEDTQPIVPNDPIEETPEVPETPDMPEVPEAPIVPETPETPELPENDEPNQNITQKPEPKVKEDYPNIEDKIVEIPKMKENYPNVVNEHPKDKVLSSVPVKINSNKQEHVSNQGDEQQNNMLPRTGSETEKQPLMIGVLMSLCGLVLLKRRKKEY